MKVTIQIKRQKGPKEASYWQSFACEAEPSASIAALLKELGERRRLLDTDGQPGEPPGWECGCMLRKCGACAMRINSVPRLACSVFLEELGDGPILLEPLSKFPVVRDLIVDRSALFDSMKELQLWLTEDARLEGETHEQRYQSAQCLQCGCCLEVCPNFVPGEAFTGAAGAVNAYRILDESVNAPEEKLRWRQYEKFYYEGCGKSLACHSICPIELPVEELLLRSNGIAIWKRR